MIQKDSMFKKVPLALAVISLILVVAGFVTSIDSLLGIGFCFGFIAMMFVIAFAAKAGHCENSRQNDLQNHSGEEVIN